MSRVTCKYMGVVDGDEEGKTHLNPTPLPTLLYAYEIKPDYDTFVEFYG